MTPANKACGLSPLLSVPWAGLRAWLDDAERTQALTGGATTHLAHAQLLALSQLVRFGGDEPTLPKEDHVSKLMQFIQSKQLEPPAFETGEPVDVPVKGAFQLRWHCTCVLPWCNQTFPKRENGKPPALFSSKKDAKQYAAMLAVAYLNSATKELATSLTPRKSPQEATQLPRQQASQMPPPQLPPSQPAPTQLPQQPHSESVPAQQQQHTYQCASRQPQQQQSLTLPTPVRPVTPTPTSLHAPVSVAASSLATPPSTNPMRAKRPLDSPTAPGSDNGSPTKQRHCSPAAAAAPSPPSPSASPPAADADAAAMAPPVSSAKGHRADAAAESSRLSAVLAKLCARLGASQPQYQITQNPDRPGFFSGFAKFSPGSRVPEGIAVVQDVLGKKQARIQIDAQVLAWMEKEEARRQKLIEGMLS
ncbi:hypothetical protein BB8028_0003g13690 [Beauveria bassiana]|uniref:DRBM domain-containing protein n=1 Tax=Beauveria bassiana TaxID=176275 RepID=A0A2S7Y9Q6_BEABA|nr:hypothetical protein BB8028_0003g13690 [Beauveria bassiana]